MSSGRPTICAAAAEERPGERDLAGALAALDARRRDRLLEAVAIAARELLRSSDLKVSLPKVAEEIGCATGVDRMHIFLVDAVNGDGRILQHYLWTAPGTPTPAEFQNPSMPMADAGLSSWIPKLERGETITGHTREFDPSVRGLFESGGVKSVLCVPVFVDGQWKGLIGFDDCRSEREWSAAEIGTINTLAELVGGAVGRAAHLKTMADAKRIVESSPTVLYRLSPDPPFGLTFVSDNVSRYGYAAEKLLAERDRWLELVSPNDAARLMEKIGALSDGTVDHVQIDFRLKKPDGSLVWFDSEGYALRDRAGKLTGIEGILTDITERKNSERDLAFSNILLTTAIENSPDAILIVGADNQIIRFNQNFVELWGIPPALASAGDDEPVLNLVASRMKDKDQFLRRVRYIYDHPEIQSHEELEVNGGRVIERHSGSLYDTQRKYLGRVWFFRDITEKKRAAEKIAMLARTDSLTGLANRATFLDRLGLEFARARRSGTQFAVLYLDLDHFKDINDTLGHPVGDQLLRAVGGRLKDCLRETDMVARFGGDEFAVLQVDIADTAASEALANKIGEVIARPFTIGSNQITTTVSIGVVPYRSGIAGTDAMIMKADLALYRAKSEGRNQFRFHVAELDDETRERMVIADDLRHAIERNELELFYQPQVDVKSGWIVGLEALIRWNHPRRGLLLPSTFIRIAETSGSIVAIGEWVFAQVCRQIGEWSSQRIAPPVVAVNVSSAQFKLAHTLDAVIAKCLAQFKVSPRQIELELTETVLMETTQKYRDALDRLRRLGVRLAIDDFGTGYSSLDYLRSFRVSRLKIDRRFIEHVTTNPEDATIVRATIGLAHALSIMVVAEGVETAEQRDFLISAGCKLAQGFYFGPPMPAKTAAALLRRHRQLAAG
jgi:diguanylate cyclase (GGDEF)-like protein/PAS domain S-box-containing protein